ncbi:MAG: hypothetical protein ACLGIR_04435 [Actinomycetes bacterium]
MAVVEDRRIELQAHDWVSRAALPEVVAYLRQVLTPRLTALLGGVREARATREWAEGLREPSSATQARLRAAAQVSRIVEATFDAQTVQSWIQGMDPMLDDQSPLWVLRHAEDEDDLRRVLQSARRFVVQ